jgi:hypothetical protein
VEEDVADGNSNGVTGADVVHRLNSIRRAEISILVGVEH